MANDSFIINIFLGFESCTVMVQDFLFRIDLNYINKTIIIFLFE